VSQITVETKGKNTKPLGVGPSKWCNPFSFRV
jgi:hypothetical protein